MVYLGAMQNKKQKKQQTRKKKKKNSFPDTREEINHSG